ncbi:MAG: DJ-1 family protein [Clostridiales bacterium]|nr:MAG: DJ-1 family protein [Clostridiales bacterium]
MICILLADGFEEAEALVPCDMLRRAGFDAVLCGITAGVITGAHGIRIEPDINIADISLPQIEAVILPGGMPGASNIDECPDTDRILQYVADKNLIIGAICAAPFILGKRGLLHGRAATCFPSFEKYLEGAIVKTDSVVCDKNIITAKAAGSAFDFAFELISALKDSRCSAEIRQGIFYEKY